MKQALDIEMQPVDSSNIEAIGHHPESNTVRIQFRSGSTFDYPGDAAEFKALAKAKSIGGHFHKVFRPRKFTKVSE